MKTILALLTALRGLSFAGRLTPALAFLPGIGPVIGFASAAASALLAFGKMLLEGISNIVGNPVTLVTVAAMTVGSFAYGMRTGVEMDGQKATNAAITFNNKLREMEADNKVAIAEAVDRALKAAASVQDPADDAALVALCNRSPECRSKGKL